MLERSILSSLAIVAVIAAPSAFAQSAPDITGLAATAAQKGSVRVIVSFAEPATAKAAETALTAAATARADDAHRAALRVTQRALLASAFGKEVADSAIAGVEAVDPSNITLMDVMPALAATLTKEQLGRLAADPRVTSIVEDVLAKPTLNQSTAIIRMNGATGAWSKGAHGGNRIVAVLDTGVNKNHEFLKFTTAATKVVSEACYNTNDATYGSRSRCPGGAKQSTAAGSGADCTVFDGCGHGTHVAGIAAGKNTSANGSEPLKGVAFNAGVLAINVFSRFDRTHSTYPCGYGATKDCLLSWSSDQIKAMERVYALRNGVGTRKIAAINMSLGGSAYTSFCNATNPTYTQTVTKLRNAGIAVVIAAGNSYYTNAVSFPGCISDATTVGASTKTVSGSPEKIASYSNIGAAVDLLAPGGDFGYPASYGDASQIYASYKGTNATYAYLSGTSMAAPHVAGAFAAIKSRAACANKTVAQIENAMKKTGFTITDTRSGGTLARKRINVTGVVTYLCP